MMDEFSMLLPRRVYAGFSSLSHIDGIIKETGASKVAIFTDKGIEKAGLVDVVLKNILAEYRIFDDLPAEPTYLEAQALVDEAGAYGSDLIIAVGGGSVMDTAKLASLLQGGQIRVKDLLDSPLIAKKRVRTLMIPTTAGTGAEATLNAIVAVPEQKLKVGIVNPEMMSDYVILDPEMIRKLPMKISASTGVDALCHAIECYTGNKANYFSDIFALEALSLIMNNIEKAVKDPDAMDAKVKMQIASFYAGIAITSSGTTAVHALSYPLGGRYHIAHGVSNAILLVPVMKFNEDAISSRLASGYDRCYGHSDLSEKEKSRAMIERMEEIVKSLEIPSNLATFNVGLGDLDDLVEAGMKVTRLLNNNMKTVTREDARRIYSQILC